MFAYNFHIIIYTFFYIIIKYQFISSSSKVSTMITEALTISAILGACAGIAWLTKVKFQPGIEKDLADIVVEEQAITPKNSRAKTPREKS